MRGHHKVRKEGKIDSKSALDRPLPAAIVVLFCLAFFGVYSNIYPITSFNIKSVAEVVIPVLETEDADPTAGQSGNDTLTPVLWPTPSSPSEDTKMSTDPEMREAMEIASKEPSVEEVTKREDHLRGASSNPTSHTADPVLPKVASPSLDNTTTSYQNPTQPSTEPYTGVTPQLESPQIPPPDSLADTETSPQPPLDLPMDTAMSPQTPLVLPTDTQTSSQPPPAGTAPPSPPQAPAPSSLPAKRKAPPQKPPRN